MPFAYVHGTRVRYREAGRGRPGTPILLVHGAGGSSAIWLTTLHRLGRLRHTVALDLPGPESFAAMRDHVGLFSATMCLGPSILVGHSLGGLLVLAAALAWPDKVVGLGLVTAAPKFSLSRRLLSTLQDDFGHWPDFLEQVGHSPDTPRDLARRSAGLATLADQKRTLNDFMACLEYDATPELGAVRAPTLVVSGADDMLAAPKWSDVLAERIPGARAARLPRCGHFPMHEQPDLFAAALADFVRVL